MDTNRNKEIFARNLARYMERKGVTNQQLCDALDFKYTTFMDWRKGATYPRIGKIEAMAEYFGILKSDLIEEKSEADLEMQKNNDAIADIVNRLYDDVDFQELNKILYPLNSEQIKSITQMIKGFM